ncbi:4-coumarate--CoA ligase-like 7 [Ananas comosus]|uniref:4-coumarate--CoA ligase n=1 Tax=Ananas comosus TaxID=4615 RepID=A0A6P5GMK8_ANACO|nr:4-coumarate--CoA ligase-like 7 [Ananas comosus]
MAAEAAPPPQSPPDVDPRSGFCAATRTFHSLRPTVPLPPPSLPLSFPSFAFSFLPSSPLPSHPALIDAANGDAISYPELLSQIRSLAAALRSSGAVSKGDVAFILSPLPSHPALIDAANGTSSTAHKLPSNLPTILLDSPRFRSFLQISESYPTVEAVVIRQSDSAAILYSSGTTGRVKGVLLTHRNLIAATAPLAAAASAAAAAPAARMLLTVPLFHAYGFAFCLKAAAVGETAVIQTERFDAKRTLKAVARFRLTHLALAPPAVLALVKFREAGCAGAASVGDVSSLAVVTCSGAPIGTDLIRRFLASFPNARLTQGYGLTETTTGVFRFHGEEASQRIGSVGRLVWGCEAKIVDSGTGIALPPGARGELWIRGPLIMQGYIGDERSTSEILNSEGWFKTGDLCYIDDDGFLFILDRLKELIKYKGYQVPPAELEHLLQTHPEITEAAVIPYPDENAGQVPIAFVVRQPNSTLNEAQVTEFVSQQVAPYKKIRRAIFVESIPKNASGKTLRKDLVQVAFSRLQSKL